jgi:hypothetical protein
MLKLNDLDNPINHKPFMCPWCKVEHFATWITEEQVKEEIPCSACDGSGWYDSCDKHGNPIKCSACRGTGIKQE